MAMHGGGNAMNRGTARKSAKFIKPKKKTPRIVTLYKGALSEGKATSRGTSTGSPVTARSKGAAKGRSKMMGGKGRYVGPKKKR